MFARIVTSRSRRALSSSSTQRALYRVVFRSAGTYWAAIILGAAAAGYVFETVTQGLWEWNNDGKLFHHMIHKFPEKVGGDDEEEEEEDAAAPSVGGDEE